MSNKKKAAKFSKLLLSETRELAEADEFKPNRLPDWLEGANVRIGHLHRTSVFIFTPSLDGDDRIDFRGEINSIIELLADVPDSYNVSKTTPPHPPNITPKENQGLHLIGGGGDEGKSPIFDITMDSPNLFDVRSGHHPPTFLSNILIRFIPNEIPIATGYVPFGVLFHDYDFENTGNLLRIFRQNAFSHLQHVHNSFIGDYYERRKGENATLVTTKEDSVIVLGDYDGGEHEEELVSVRNELESNGYHASLIKELPEHPSQSLPQKVKLWCLSSRFVVVIDRDPSGHIREYTELANEEIPVALLRNIDSGSTFMIGHEHHTDDYIELFEFASSPNEVTGDVIDWAEDFITELAEIYEEEYPWSRGSE